MKVYLLCPLGVPRVPFRLPGEESYHWAELYNKLYRQRILFLCSTIEDEIANQISALLVYLNAENPERPICIFINSFGGVITSGLAIIDCMNFVQAKVMTVNIGYCASMASLLLASGEPGMRWGFPHSRALVHQPLGGVSGQALYLRLEAIEVLRLRRLVTEMYFRLTRVSKQFLLGVMDSRDLCLGATQQKEFGLIDAVGSSTGRRQRTEDEDIYAFDPNLFLFEPTNGLRLKKLVDVDLNGVEEKNGVHQ